MEGSSKDIVSLRAEIEKVDKEYEELLSEYSRLTRKHMEVDLNLSSEESLTVGKSSVHLEFGGSELSEPKEDNQSEAEISSPSLLPKDISDKLIKNTLDRILQKTPINSWKEKASISECEDIKEVDKEVLESVQNNALAKVQSSKGSTLKSFVKTGNYMVEKEKRVNQLLDSERSEQAGGLEAFQMPGRRGWVREVVLSRVMENEVVGVSYLPPGDKSRKQLSSYKKIETYLAETNDVSLTKENFSLARKVLSLGTSFELTRMSSLANITRNIYREFFTVIEGSSPVLVSCNLCEGKAVIYTRFSCHMKHCHLPDETCSTCHHDIPAITFRKHSKVCDGAGPAPKGPKSIYNQFYTELDGNSFLPANKARVACNLCAAKTVLIKEQYSRHFKSFHIPMPTCTRCGKDVPARGLKKHMGICNGDWNRSRFQKDSKHCVEQKVLAGIQELGQEKDRDHKEEKEKDIEYMEKMNKLQHIDINDTSTSLVNSEFDVTLHEASQTSMSTSSVSEIEMYSETDSE